jgi:hypothetical protein
MSHAAQLARIATLVEGVTDVGRVHTWPRYGDAAEHWVTTIDGEPQVRAWEIGLDESGIQALRHTEVHVAHYINWLIRGYLGLDDQAAAYNTIIALAESIRAALEGDTTLAGTCLNMVGENGGVPDVSEPGTVEIGSGPLCWTVTIRFTTYEL